ncbi:crossover junction endodeoxyribonuclease RuvC [Aureibacter tunicatorum]|uniref:Crossover junction endodeoxyribonuclease RuvC n=2 Tax=Aureibacter tunicatorum TaxID=866807 RepID=A0AAE3XRC7_9BACT|nr:crossover junction endodeoxyribonuclease RuvC [Aureibacter tunicatorum]
MNNSKEKIIMGIDPGTSIMGYAVIMIKGKNISVMQYGVIHLKKYASHELKLKKIFDRVLSLIEEYLPDEMALEAPFFGKNVQSMLKLGRAQGIAMAAALSREIPITEYAPRKIKKAITGNGAASKEQIARSLQQQLGLNDIPEHLDATDALGVALCHHYNSGVLPSITTSSKKSSKPTNSKTSKSNSWDDFIQSNPNRIKK